MRGTALILGIACLLATAPVVAGTLYRCDDGNGGRSYVSKRPPGAKCVVVSQYRSGGGGTRNPRPVSYAPPPAPAMGTVTPANTVAGEPASIHANPPATFMGVNSTTPNGTASSSKAPAAASPSPAVAAPPMPSKPPTRLVQGQVYSYIKDGVRHYTSVRPKGLANASAVRTIKYSFIETCYACAVLPGVNFGSIRLNTVAYSAEIAAAAAQWGVEEAIVRAIIHAESAYNPTALSRAGAQGLMQLMPATARRFGVSNSFDATQNIQGGVQYLSWLLKRFNGNLTLAAAGYNAGEGAVDRYQGVPPYAETQRYVQRVAILVDRYRGGTPVAR